MWFSRDEAVALVRALTADVEHAQKAVEEAEARRAAVLAQLHGQEIPVRELCELTGMSTTTYYRAIRAADPHRHVLPNVLPDSEARAALRALRPTQRITESNRIRVA